MLLLETAVEAELLPFELDEFAGSGAEVAAAAAAVDAAVKLLAVAMLASWAHAGRCAI